jgi:hypothetical protein
MPMAISPVEQYIRQRAAAYGIDPNVAVKVAKGEGGLQDPFRRGAGPAPRSQAPGLGPTENSYGPLQLYVSGTGAGLGDRALAAGIDPRKDWQGGVDFALKEASQKGWGQWYGAKAQGITGKMGIGGDPYAGMPDGPKGQEAYSPPGLGGQPGLAVATNSPGILGVPQDVADYAASPEPKSFGERLQGAFKVLADTPDAPPVRFKQLGDVRQTGDGLLKALNAPKFGDTLLQKRLG